MKEELLASPPPRPVVLPTDRRQCLPPTGAGATVPLSKHGTAQGRPLIGSRARGDHTQESDLDANLEAQSAPDDPGEHARFCAGICL